MEGGLLKQAAIGISAPSKHFCENSTIVHGNVGIKYYAFDDQFLAISFFLPCLSVIDVVVRHSSGGNMNKLLLIPDGMNK